MKHQVGRDWDPVATSLLDYRRRARTRNALTHASLIGVGLAFIGLFALAALGVSSFLRYIFGVVGPHLPAIAWASPQPRGAIEALAALLG